MIKIHIDDILEKKGRTRYWLQKRMDGISYQNLCNIANNKTKSIQFRTLEDLAKTLDCSFDELLEIIET